MKVAFKEIGMSEVEQFQKALLDEIEELGSDQFIFILDFEDVEKICLSGIQILIALSNYCKEKEITLVSQNIQSDQLSDTFKIYNLNKTLGINND